LPEDDEPTAVEDLVPPDGDVAGNALQGEVRGREVFRAAAGGTIGGERLVDRREVRAGQRERVGIRGREVGPSPRTATANGLPVLDGDHRSLQDAARAGRA